MISSRRDVLRSVNSELGNQQNHRDLNKSDAEIAPVGQCLLNRLELPMAMAHTQVSRHCWGSNDITLQPRRPRAVVSSAPSFAWLRSRPEARY